MTFWTTTGEPSNKIYDTFIYTMNKIQCPVVSQLLSKSSDNRTGKRALQTVISACKCKKMQYITMPDLAHKFPSHAVDGWMGKVKAYTRFTNCYLHQTPDNAKKKNKKKKLSSSAPAFNNRTLFCEYHRWHRFVNGFLVVQQLYEAEIAWPLPFLCTKLP